MTFCASELASYGVSPEVLEARALRRRLKVTQAEFAAMAGVSRGSVLRYELGKRKVRPVVADKIRSLVEQWRVKPPVLQRKPENRGAWKRRQKPANDNAFLASSASHL